MSGTMVRGNKTAGGNSQPSSESELIRGYLVSRDERVFAALVTPHLSWLRRLLFAIFNGNRPDMEDAEQEILLGLLSDLERYRAESTFKTFFYRYARNKAIDHLRRLVRRRRREKATAGEERGLETPSPEELYLRGEKKRTVAGGLLALDSVDRTLVLMKDTEGFGIEEMARVTGLKEGTIKSRLHRARAKLFRLLEGEEI